MEELGDNATPESHPASPEDHGDPEDNGDLEDHGDPEDPDDSKDSNYLPLSKDEESLGAEDFIVHKDPLEQERFKQ